MIIFGSGDNGHECIINNHDLNFSHLKTRRPNYFSLCRHVKKCMTAFVCERQFRVGNWPRFEKGARQGAKWKIWSVSRAYVFGLFVPRCFASPRARRPHRPCPTVLSGWPKVFVVVGFWLRRARNALIDFLPVILGVCSPRNISSFSRWLRFGPPAASPVPGTLRCLRPVLVAGPPALWDNRSTYQIKRRFTSFPRRNISQIIRSNSKNWDILHLITVLEKLEGWDYFTPFQFI